MVMVMTMKMVISGLINESDTSLSNVNDDEHEFVTNTADPMVIKGKTKNSYNVKIDSQNKNSINSIPSI